MKTNCPSHDELRQLLGDSAGRRTARAAGAASRRLRMLPGKLEELATGGTNLSQVVEGLHQVGAGR